MAIGLSETLATDEEEASRAVHTRQQLAAAQRLRLGEAPGDGELRERRRVDPGAR